MKYFKNAELARTYDVSEKAVRNWIEAAQEKKVELDLVAYNEKAYIADSDHNNLVLERLVKRGKKYRNKNTVVEVTPSEAFYSLYSPAQVIDIANSIEKYREIPSHYRYIGDGALLWDAHLRRLYESERSNMLTTTIELLRLERSYFDFLLDGHKHINIVDIGVGNGLAAKELIEYFHAKGKLRKYIGIDCSQNLLNIATRNIDTWFEGNVATESHVYDVNHERFTAALSNDSYGDDAEETVNVILFLGGTIGNFRNPSHALQTIHESMGKNDILITSDELDGEDSRKYMGSSGLETFATVCDRNKILLNLLSIEDKHFELGKTFDHKLNASILSAIPKNNIKIAFKIGNFSKTLHLHKNDPLILFRMWEWSGHTLDDLYERNGFTQVRTTKLHNQEFVLLVSKVKAASSSKDGSV